jgi:transcriptional regulator with XRE-family HTH domain
MTIPQRLHALREENNMTLDEVARRIGTTRQTMSRYETGVITKIEYDTIVALANVYHVHPGYIMGWCERDGSTGKTVSAERKKLLDLIEQLPAEQLDLYLTLFAMPTERLRAIVDLLK